MYMAHTSHDWSEKFPTPPKLFPKKSRTVWQIFIIFHYISTFSTWEPVSVPPQNMNITSLLCTLTSSCLTLLVGVSYLYGRFVIYFSIHFLSSFFTLLSVIINHYKIKVILGYNIQGRQLVVLKTNLTSSKAFKTLKPRRAGAQQKANSNKIMTYVQ